MMRAGNRAVDERAARGTCPHACRLPGRILHDEGGASIIIALVFMLICLMVAAVIVSEATINAERSGQSTTEDQDYLTLTSATRISKDVFSTDPELSALTVTVESADADPVATKATGDIASWAVAQSENVIAGRTTSTLKLPIKATSPYDSTALSDATVTYSMDKNFKITAEVGISSSAKYDYTLKTTIIPYTTGYTVDETTGAVTYTYPFSVTWNKVTTP